MTRSRVATLSLPVVLCLAGLVGCAGPEVHYDYDARAHFPDYRSYAWEAEPAGPGPSAGFSNAIMNARVRRAVDQAMAAKGFHEAGSQHPDILVRYYPALVSVGRRRVHVGVGFGLGPIGLGVAGPVGDPYRDATASMVLEVQDFQTRNLVWKAEAEGVLHGSDSPEEADHAVTEAVQAMFQRFPPGR